MKLNLIQVLGHGKGKRKYLQEARSNGKGLRKACQKTKKCIDYSCKYIYIPYVPSQFP